MSDYDFSSSRTSCACHCIKFILGLGVLALILWLSLRTTKPKCSIGDVYVRGLDKSINSNNNTMKRDNHLSFQVHLKNEMKDKAVRYDNITVNFYYGTNTSYPLGNFTIEGFKQGKDKEAFKSGMIETHNMPWDDAIKVVSNGSKAIFRVDVSSRIKYKITFWYTKKHNYFVENKVEVDNTGKSSAKQISCCFGFFGLILFVLSFLL
ncbi:protein NDR1-like [Solanum dulcamara]|uniref:protein NDR1-like n=1 Tax=Solanum dulcamara TaxID=45834 RepID=UPI0024857BE6|nr:protein NDR1-like [Solanum dulcamara]